MSPMRLADYHPDWAWISRQIRGQAGDVCEFCQVPNGALIQRNASGDWIRWDELGAMNSDAGWSWLGTWDPPPPVTVVLTVAHLCHDTTCIDPTHLRALCQRCHLGYDRPHHERRSAETRARKRAEAMTATGQLGLEEVSA